MSLEHIAEEMRRQYGERYARRWLIEQRAHDAERRRAEQSEPHHESTQEPYLEHDSHLKATELLEPHKKALGAAYPLLHVLARWSIENATEDDPAPHLMTCYWTLEEIVGRSERHLRRYLIEDGWRWSEAVRHLIDVRPNYGERLDGKDEQGKDKYSPCTTSMVIRFFPRGRQGKQARVKRWGRRDLLAESDEGRTRPTRNVEKVRYKREEGQMSAYSSVEEQSEKNNWLLVRLGQTVSHRVAKSKDFGSLYADIPKNHVLDALRADLSLSIENARARGANIKRARSRWVDTAAQVLAARHEDHRPLPHHLSEKHVTHVDGFTDLWRRALWTAVKAEMYGGTTRGWLLIQEMIERSQEAKIEGYNKPSAWAWSKVREEMEALRRDYGSGAAGSLEA